MKVDLKHTGSIPELRRYPGEGQGNPLQYSCWENPMDRGAWQARVHRVTKSWMRLKWLSMHAHKSVYHLSLSPLSHIYPSFICFPTSTVEWVVKSPGSGMSEFQCSSSLVIWLRIALLPTFGFLFHKWGQFWDLCPHIKLSRAGWDSAGQVLSLIFNTPAVHSQLCLSFLQASIEQNKTEVPQSEMLVAGGLS